ncbi:hypothetical protein [Algoriphagus sp. A40]|uniref:hypothetical protein n=1 Tax=Algoriphagus sp. A40 TaxID=1945863 RepID=UPI000986A093|nr:hypothetical protein [Algoriphagus sp. A40]OOG78823.1 hypothetical protein B0E43_00210 [Algoriphagus sp. A40]
MNELLIYSFLLVVVLGHCTAAVFMYRELNADTGLTFREKNDWKLKALVSPALYWYYYRQEKKRRIS